MMGSQRRKHNAFWCPKHTKSISKFIFYEVKNMYERPSILSFSISDLKKNILVAARSSCPTFDSDRCDPNAQLEGGSYGGGAHNR